MLAVTLLKERASRRAWIGIVLSLPAMLMLSWQPPAQHATYGSLWLLPAVLVFLMWAVQAYPMKFSTACAIPPRKADFQDADPASGRSLSEGRDRDRLLTERFGQCRVEHGGGDGDAAHLVFKHLADGGLGPGGVVLGVAE